MKYPGLIILIILLMTSCTEQSDTCPSGKVMDKRFRTLPSKTLGICIDEKCTDESEYCCSSVVEDGKCISELKVGDKCTELSDCGEDAPLCLADPMVRKQILLTAKELNLNVNNEMLDLLGLNYCTIMECEKDDITCPEGSRCEEIGPDFYLCNKIEEEKPDSSPPDEDIETPDIDYGTCPETCKTHDECKIDGCERTFCASVLTDFAPEATNKCVIRCNPDSSTNTCPPDHMCVDISHFENIVDLDGTKGLCAPGEPPEEETY